MKKNNKKGFTLIEIIITLGLILLITGVAIGSFVGISKQKKKEEWGLVKGQIETAAEQYFSSNKYMFEDVNSSVTAYITVGELVEKSYLNNVSNPETGEKVSYCNQVQVTYEDGKYTGKYEDTSATNNKEECKYTSGSVVIKEPGAAEGSISLEKVENADPNPLKNFYKDRVKFVLNITKHKNSVSKVMGCVSDSAACSPEEELTYNNSNGKAETIYNESGTTKDANITAQSCFKVINNTSSGEKTLKICGTANVDSKKPTCTAKLVTTWTNAKFQNVTATCNDDGVGCEHDTYTNTVTEESRDADGTKTEFTVSDRFAHTNTCYGYAKIDRTKPTLSVSLYRKSSGNDISSSSGLSRYTNNTWLSGWVYTEANATDTLSGLNACYYTTTGKTSNAKDARSCQRNINAEGTSYVKYKACDNVGNCTDYTNNYTVKLDRTAPEITHSGTYTANCKSFKELAGNSVEYRNKIYIEDYLSGVNNTGYEYTYSSGPGTYTGWIENSHSLARSNTEILSRNSDNSWSKIRQDYNFLNNDDSTFTIQATDNAGNTSNKITTSQSKHNSTSSSGYCRNEHGENSTVKENYLKKCSSSEINCYVSKDD